MFPRKVFTKYGARNHTQPSFVFSQQWNYQNNVLNLFRVDDKDTKTTFVVLISLMLTFNRFHTFF